MPDQALEPGVLLIDRQQHWTYRLPPRLRDLALLARWDRPIGTWLLLLPCWWGLALAAPGWPSAWLALLFAVGAIAMRGAGCTINDMADRDLDAQVKRTRNRPLAAGRVTMIQAGAFALTQMLVGLLVLTRLNQETVLLAFGSVPLILLYPFMKRVTWWPQAVLGLAFNWGALVGFSAVTGSLRWETLLLYAAGVFWTLGYDTIYAHQDKNDDVLVGVRSTALRLGEGSRAWISVFYAIMLVLIAVAGWIAGKGPLMFVGLLVVAGLLGRQALTVRFGDPADCLRHFRANRVTGLAVVAALLAGNLPL